MSRSRIRRISLRGRIAVMVSAGALATGGAIALIGSATSSAAQSAGTSSTCSNATLNGTYLESSYAWLQLSGPSGPWTPVSTSSTNTYNNGNETGTASFVAGTSISSFVPTKGTYRIKPDCTGTLTVTSGTGSSASTSLYDLYVNPAGSSFEQVETEAGVAATDTEFKVS